MNCKSLPLNVLVGLGLLFSGCRSFPDKPSPTPSITPAPSSTAVPTVTVTSYPTPDLSRRPLVFFGPLPKSYNGSLDFMDLFTENAPWNKAAQHIQVLSLSGGWVVHFPWEPEEATEEELRAIISEVNRRGLALGFEASPLVATEECGQGVEGFFGPEEGLRIVQTLKQLDANVSFVSLDEPFAFGHIYDGPQACHWTPEKIARQVDSYIKVIKSVYPEAVIGDIEPLWLGVDVQELVNWLDIYKAVTGSNFPSIDLDLDYARADWSTAAKQLEDAARARGIEFGIFYIGDAGDTTDEEWLNKAFERARQYELVAGGKPDRVKFQSWHDHPNYVLPETKPDTFTALINSYSRPRTALSLDIGINSSDGSQNASGTLADINGAPLTNAMIELTMTALDGPGVVAEYTITSTVPVRATSAVVGFRVNTECGCQGISDFTLYQARYVEGQETVSRVPNGSFIQGLANWGKWGSGTIRLEPSDQDKGRMLHVKTIASQDAAINSASFPVTAGSTYTLTFVASVSPDSFGSGYFDIVFLDGAGEITRERIQLVSATVPIGTAITDTQGHYTTVLDSLPPGDLLLEANYAGSDQYWPAYASTQLLSK